MGIFTDLLGRLVGWDTTSLGGGRAVVGREEFCGLEDSLALDKRELRGA